MQHAAAPHPSRRQRLEESLPARDWDRVLHALLPMDMPFVPGNRLLEDIDLAAGRHLALLHHPGPLTGEDQYRYNLVLRDSDGAHHWLGGVNTFEEAPRFWSVEARLELSAGDVVGGLYHAGWEYRPFVDWLERLAALREQNGIPPAHIGRIVDAASRYAREVHALWRPFEDPTWIDAEVETSFPGPVSARGRESALETQRLELARRFGMPAGAFRREAHRWAVDWRKVPDSHPSTQTRRGHERLPTMASPAASSHAERCRPPRHPRITGPTRARVRPSLSLAGLYQAIPERRALVETLAAGVKKGAGRPGANVGVMWRLATSAIYASGDLPLLAAREALQNSRDGLRAAYRQRALKPGEGRFEIRWDPSTQELVFEDTGVGMDVETILGPFLTLGESTKRGEGGTDAAGGFGIAKAVILGASSTFRWELHTRDNLARSDGPDRDVEVFQAEERAGVRLTLFDVSGDAVWDYAGGHWRDVGSRMRELLAACDMPDIQLYYNGELISPLFSRRKGSPVEVDGSWGEGTTARVKAYRRPDRGGAYWIRLDGLPQFKQASVSGNLRADVVIDLSPTARPGAKGYPLNASRDQFIEPARSTFRAVVRAVEKENLSVGKKKEDEVFALEEGTAEDEETREALLALEAELLQDPELAALLGEPEQRDGASGPDSSPATLTRTPGDGSVAVSESADILQRFLAGAELQLPGVTASGEPPLPAAIIEIDPHAVLPVRGAESELPGFPSELSTPAQVRRLFQTMAVVGHHVPMSAQAALDAAMSGTLTGNALRELAEATTVALDVYAGRMAPESAGIESPEELEQVWLPVGSTGQTVLPDRFLSPDPATLRAKLLSADAHGHHFPALIWDSLTQVEATGALSRQQLHMLRAAEEEAVAVNAGSVLPMRVPLAPLDVPDPDAYAIAQHKKYVSLEETGGRIPGLPPGLNTYDQVKAFLIEGLRLEPGAVPEDEVERVLGAITADPIHYTDLMALVELVRKTGQTLQQKTASIETPGAPRARVNKGGVSKRPSGTNPFGAAAAVRIAAGYPKDRARAFKRNPSRWLPYLSLWTLALKLVSREAKIERRFKPGFLLDDDTIGLASKQDGDRYALILVNADRFQETVKANRERPLSIAAFVHGVAVHELSHLDGKMGDGHDEEYVAKREDLGTETAHLLPALTKAAVKLLKLPEPKDPQQAKLLKLERELERAREGRDAAKADRLKAVRELEKALRDCRRVLEEQGGSESIRTGQACEADGPPPVTAHIRVEPKPAGPSLARGTFTDLEMRAVLAATQSMQGSRERWAFLSVMGATDEELEAALRYELGSRGGLNEPGGFWVDYSGTTLTVTVKSTYGAEFPIRGRRLLLATRRLYGIEDFGEVDARIRRVLFVLIDRVRSALPEGIPSAYLYNFFARNRQTLIDALARRFGASDPALLPARPDMPAQEPAQIVSSWTSAGGENARLESRHPADRARFSDAAEEETLPRWTPTPFSRPGPGQRTLPLDYGDDIPGAEWLRIGDPVRFLRAHRCPVWQVTIPAGTLATVESESFGKVAVLLEASVQNPNPEDMQGWIETVYVPLQGLEDVLEVY